MRIFLMLFLFCAMWSNNSYAKKNLNCLEKEWPLKRMAYSKSELYQILSSFPKQKLISFMFYELFHKNNINYSVPITHYLSATENNINLKGFYKSLIYLASDKKYTPAEALEIWPKQVIFADLKKAKDVICNEFQKAGLKENR